MENKVPWILLSVVLIVLAIVSTGPLLMSLMMFDNVGPGSEAIVEFLFFAIMSFPLTCVSGAILPWLVRKRPIARWLFGLPMVSVALVVIGFVALKLLCGGAFGCR